MPNIIKEIHWGAIINSLKERSCVPFLGAGVNVSTDEYQGLPLANDVALRIVRRLAGLEKKHLKELIENSSQSVKAQIENTLVSLKKESGTLPTLLRVTLPDLSLVTLQVEVEVGFPRLMKYVREILSDKDVQPSPLLQV